MAITNAQQYQQLVNPPMKGKKRPGYRGEAAAASDAAGGRNAGRSDTGSASGRGDGPAKGRDNFGQFERRQRQNEALKGSGFLGKDQGMNIGVQNRLAKFGDFITGGGTLGAIARAINFNPPSTYTDMSNQGNEGINNMLYRRMIAQQAGTMDNVPEEDDEEEKKLEGLRLAFRAEGGSMNDQIRQAYGLGSIVKKAVGAVKKVAKSPVGKAAITAAGIYALGGGGNPFTAAGRGGFSFANLPGAGLFKKGAIDRLAFNAARTTGTGGLLSKFPGGGIGAAITAASLLPLLGIGTGEEDEDEAQAILQGQGLDINAIRANPNQYLARAFRAEGGSMDEPVAKKTMPLLDMGGKEMDLRAEGGFVPIGRMEKADDVPARLSKNEFVFTAEAVRNAGEGDVDKGAEVMYNMMKNLEAGGDVSKESQGLEGARSMFQTSQRLEEVL